MHSFVAYTFLIIISIYKRKNSWKSSNLVWLANSSLSQPACNIRAIFAECSGRVTVFGTSREHLGNILRKNFLLKVLDGEVVFMLKVYDLIITNVDLLANFSNHELMFPEYLRNIPRMYVSGILYSYVENIFRSQKVQQIVLSVILWKFQYWQSPLFETVFHLE